jgi:hypothetical protein
MRYNTQKSKAGVLSLRMKRTEIFLCMTVTFFHLILWQVVYSKAKHSGYRCPKLLRQLCPRQALTKYFLTLISKLSSF